jgi:hypothetical protein
MVLTIFLLAPVAWAQGTVYSPARAALGAAGGFTAGAAGNPAGAWRAGSAIAQAASQREAEPGTSSQGTKQAFTVNGDGHADNSAAVQAAVDACAVGATCLYHLVNAVIRRPVMLSATREHRFRAEGGVIVCEAEPACFERTGGNAAHPNPYRWSFTGFTFKRDVSGPVILDNLTFASGGNQGLTLDDDTFNLTGGAVGWAGTGSDFNVFNNDAWNLCPTCTALEPGGQNGNYGPQTTEVTNNSFRLGTAVTPDTATCSYGWQGWTFTANQFWSSRVTAACGNAINFVGNQFVSSHFTVDSLYNSEVIGNYFDGPGGTNGQIAALMTVTNTYHNTVETIIEGNYFQIAPEKHLAGILFVNGSGDKAQTQIVTMTGNMYGGASKSAVDADYGVVFDDPQLVGVYLGGEHFLQVYAALDFKATLRNSTIDRFEGDTLSYWALGIPSYVQTPGVAALHNITDSIYKIIPVHIAGYLPARVGGNTVVASNQTDWGSMFGNPTLKFLPLSADTCTAGWSISNSGATGASTSTLLSAGPGAAPGPGSCGALLIVDGTVNTDR